MVTALVLAALGFGGLAAGILVGRYYVPDDRALRRSARHARAYLRALNHLLSRDRDAAVDELKEVVADDVADLEPYFALGALFRARGEWERAIRVHQAIELRGARDREVRERARYALGLDFRAAGMPRRATRALEECLADDPKHVGALRALSGLYEEQGRYVDAAAAWRRLHKIGGHGNPQREHHLLVAAAQRAVASGDLGSAKRLLRDAERLDEDSPHLLVASAEMAAAKGDVRAARRRLRRALELAPDLTAALADGLYAAELELAADDADPEATAAVATAELLAELARDHGRAPQLALAAASVRARVAPEEALAEVRMVAELHPELLSARIAAGRLALASGDEESIREELRALVAADGALGWADGGRWRCARCGRSAATLTWRCQRCRHWGAPELDAGTEVLEPDPPAPRERRALPRPATAALVGPGEDALPRPALESELSDAELAAANQRHGVVARAAGWLSAAVRGGRGDTRED